MKSRFFGSILLLFLFLSGCKSFSTAPLRSTSGTDAATTPSVSTGVAQVAVLNSKEFNSLTPDFVLDPKVRDGFTVFSEELVNQGQNAAHLSFEVKSDAIQIQTRIREDASYYFYRSNHVNRVRVSSATFRLDQVTLTRSSGVSDFLSSSGNPGAFDLAPGEKVRLEWIAHSSELTPDGGVALCPFWSHQKYGSVGMLFPVSGTLDWAMIGSSLKSNVVRSLKVEGGQDLIDEQDSTTLNQISGDGVPNANDQLFSCDGLMELLPSSN